MLCPNHLSSLRSQNIFTAKCFELDLLACINFFLVSFSYFDIGLVCGLVTTFIHIVFFFFPFSGSLFSIYLVRLEQKWKMASQSGSSRRSISSTRRSSESGPPQSNARKSLSSSRPMYVNSISLSSSQIIRNCFCNFCLWFRAEMLLFQLNGSFHFE